ncbi:MAG: phosphoribosylformylglycinamidine synthase subunit PurL [candidate division Zixibacteria bacterium]|nr:phosphoribosylformylglycinamidine synthase subunit PurL [candidate division Zixibacteria bacterium]MDH3935891.1 phosphoribosylformylglycinamidine synthase subunit PurL [candidate division Zixibacteria bacterium]MDH4032695.1 phosphoribosylformylglycinamidine synthase subunit PurL [candidate division Zixibacteria bacterium]
MPAKYQQPEVTPEMVEAHGLTKEEHEKIKQTLGREMTYTELGVYSVMWSEHCSYKNSIGLIKTLPREGKNLLAKAGEENAGAVDIGDGLAVVFKIESHNHPSAVEPYQGAATGVGGILRDIFTMGARPIAALNSLRFGSPDNPRVRYLVDGVVRGIGDYGNSFGVPTVAGEVYFDEAYTGNPLVNAMAVGIVKSDGIASAVAEGEGNPLMIVGSKTGRDGIHGATFASVELSEESEEKRSSVQIGDPFTEKLLLEATLEIIEKDLIVGIQDMGAAGITCSCSEMSAKGESGVVVDIEKVPVRETAMTPYEILLSESQERMLVCVKKGREKAVTEVFDKWGLDSTIIGHVTSDKLMTVRLNGEVVSQIPSASLVLGGDAPVYERETQRPAYLDELNDLDTDELPLDRDWNRDLLDLLATPNICHKGWVYEQYDSMVRTNTAVGPGSDAAVMRLRKTNKALAMATDCNARFCYLNPRLGAQSAVAEAARNIVCSGGQPLAVTNCLNFGNPYKPEIYYGFAQAIAGMGDACRILDTPVTGGNVSFYNEDPERAVFPTPTIGMVGLVSDDEHITTQWFKQTGDVIFLLGTNTNEIGASEYLHALHGMTKGAVPALDLEFEKKLQEGLLAAITRGWIRSAHDCAEGGLAVALAECCISNREQQIGSTTTLNDDLRTDALLFGEGQSRVVISCDVANADAVAEFFQKLELPCANIGTVGGDRLKINDVTDLPLDKLDASFFEAMPAFMEKVG